MEPKVFRLPPCRGDATAPHATPKRTLTTARFMRVHHRQPTPEETLAVHPAWAEPPAWVNKAPKVE